MYNRPPATVSDHPLALIIVSSHDSLGCVLCPFTFDQWQDADTVQWLHLIRHADVENVQDSGVNVNCPARNVRRPRLTDFGRPLNDAGNTDATF